MIYKPILIVAGEPNSIFFEIYFKTLSSKRFKSPIILIASLKILQLQMKKLNIKKKIKLIHYNKFNQYHLDNKNVNLINVDYNQKKPFEKISSKSNLYIEKCFSIALKLIEKKITNKFINGPISKKFFLKKKFLGITEYLADKTNTKSFAMLIFNKELSVCPLTTHLPLKKVSKRISKKLIVEKTKLINNFFIKHLKRRPNIAITGLNPHCETVDSFNEDENILKPAIKLLSKSKVKVSGPYAADTIFIKKNRKNYDVIVGMYHDQVLTPMKTLFEYDAINITLGLPFIRVSPDHGPNEKMLGKNLSNPKSLGASLTFLDNKND